MSIRIPFVCRTIALILFLCAGSVSAVSAATAAEEFTLPAFVCTYDEGNLHTVSGALTGGDENAPGTAVTMTVPDDGLVRNNAGYSLRIDYNVTKYGEYTFYWVKLGKALAGKQDATETLDLTRYNYLSLWIKSAAGGENIKIELHQDADGDGLFTFGKDITSYVYTNAYIASGTVTQEWQKVMIPLKEFAKITDWSKMHEIVLVFENKSGNTTGTVYLDDIFFGWHPAEAFAGTLPPIKEPVAASFTVNGVEAKQCLTFTASNDLEIRAESIDENASIESVRFEYTTDAGTRWHTIGTDYDVRSGMYTVTWNPDNSRDMPQYQVRAVATDIRGAEKATAALLECGMKPMTDDEFLNMLEHRAFNFFKDHQSPVTGLFNDASGGGDASIAATGFGLTALCIGVERGWIDRREAAARVERALDTFIIRNADGDTVADGRYGFFYHFLNMNTGKRAGKSEISTVDTAILVCGALTAGEYFGGEIKKKAEILYGNVEWEQFLETEKGPYYHLFSMGWSPERGMLESYWDFYTDEAILVTLLAIGSPTHPVDPDCFYAWMRRSDSYAGGKPFIYTWHGALFSYQYAHCWFDLQKKVDQKGVNWFENSMNATIANRQFCIDNADKFKGFGPNSWGITSMARPNCYTMHFGPPPTGSGEPQYDGTISPTGPAGSIVFTPYLSISALKYMYLTHPRLWGQYGIRDSFDLDHNWYASTYYGIGVGVMLLPIENFRSGLVWKYFMQNKHVKESLTKAGFTDVR